MLTAARDDGLHSAGATGRVVVLVKVVAAVADVVIRAERQIAVDRHRVAVFAVRVDFVVAIRIRVQAYLERKEACLR